MIRLDPAVLDAAAELVVSGTVTGIVSSWDDARTAIFTDVELAVTSYDKGGGPALLTIRVPGGEVEDIGMLVEDYPAFTAGDEVTVYLVGTAEPAVYRLFGAEQGVVSAGIDGKPEKKPPTVKLYSYSGYHREPASCYWHANTGLTSEWVAAIQAGAGAWNDAGAAFTFYYSGTTASSGPTYDGVNVVTRANLGSGGILAQNTYWYIRRGKIVVENDIVFNSYYPWSTSGAPGAYDVQNIGTHELGHDLVLNDLYASYQTEQTMYGYGALGETKKRTLESGDTEGIVRIYGAPADEAVNSARTTGAVD